MRRGLAFTVAVFVSEKLIGLLLTAVVGIFVARSLGPTEFGLFSYVGGLFALVLALPIHGFQSVIVRECSIVDDFRPVLASVWAYQLPIACLGTASASAVAIWTRGWSAFPLVLAFALLPIVALGETSRGVLESRAASTAIVLIGIGAAGLGAAIKLLGVLTEANPWVYAFATTVQAAVMAAGLTWGVHSLAHLRGLRRRYRPELRRRLAREALPLLVAAVAVVVYLRIDVVMVALLAGDRQAGVYTVAVRISELWYYLPWALLAAVRPALSRYFVNRDISAYRELSQRCLSFVTAVGYLAIVVVHLFGRQFVEFLYGDEYRTAGSLLEIHVLAAPFVFLGALSEPWFIDRGDVRAIVGRAVAGALVNVLANLALIPTMGSRGAAVATVISFAVSGVLWTALMSSGREVLVLQMRALRLAGLWAHARHLLRPRRPSETRS